MADQESPNDDNELIENESVEGNSNFNILLGSFTIDNTKPLIEFTNLTEISGSFLNRNYIPEHNH